MKIIIFNEHGRHLLMLTVCDVRVFAYKHNIQTFIMYLHIYIYLLGGCAVTVD